MAEPKTRPTQEDPAVFIDTRAPEALRHDAHSLMALMTEVCQRPPVMWGTAIIGYGLYLPPQKGASEWPLLAFSPRASSLVIYIMARPPELEALLAQLGPHTLKGSCLHLKRLKGLDLEVLKEICAQTLRAMTERFGA